MCEGVGVMGCDTQMLDRLEDHSLSERMNYSVVVEGLKVSQVTFLIESLSLLSLQYLL